MAKKSLKPDCSYFFVIKSFCFISPANITLQFLPTRVNIECSSLGVIFCISSITMMALLIVIPRINDEVINVTIAFLAQYS